MSQQKLNPLEELMQRIKYSVMAMLLLLFVAAPPLMAQDEATEQAGNPLAGFTAGVNVAYPVVTGKFYEGDTGPVVGIVVGTPYGFPLGPFSLGVGAGIEYAMFGNDKQEVGAFATVNTMVYSTPQGPISLYGGVGLLGGLGVIGGAFFDYMVPNVPLVIKPYVRANISTSAAVDDQGNSAPTGWIQLGAMLSYDISTLF